MDTNSEDKIKVGWSTHKKMLDERDKRIEQLEKALDRACFYLSKYVDYDFSPNITLEMEIRNRSAVEIEREYWKDFLINGRL